MPNINSLAFGGAEETQLLEDRGQCLALKRREQDWETSRRDPRCHRSPDPKAVILGVSFSTVSSPPLLARRF